MSTLTPGDRVIHPGQQEWGIGKVLCVTPENIDVFFVGVGAKRLSKSFVRLEIAEAGSARHPLLDNLSEASQIDRTGYVPLHVAIERFLANNPDGLEGKRFLKEEREASIRGHQLCIQLLGQDELTGLIAERRYQDVCDRARHVESVTNLLTKSEKTALYASLEQTDNQKVFAVGLADFLYGTEAEEARFKRFVRVLHLLEISKWQFVTFFGFIRFPQERALIKPTLIQNAAKSLCWRINYKSEPNWRTYDSVLRLFNYVRAGLFEEGLLPRDMIDVQAFLGSIGQK